MSISFDDLISKQFLTPVSTKVDGVGVVDIHPVSAAEAFEVQSALVDLTGEKLETYISTKALEYVKGGDVSVGEVKLFRKNVSSSAISSIFSFALASNSNVIEDVEATEKN